MTEFVGQTRPAPESMTDCSSAVETKRRRTAEANVEDLDGLTDQLNAVSLAISAAMENKGEGGADGEEDTAGFGSGMDELRRWYQTEVFAVTDAQQQRWEERRWAFLGQLQHALNKPLTHTVFSYKIHALNDEDDDAAEFQRTLARPRELLDRSDLTSAFGGLLFVGRSRYNDVVVADETVSRVHCIIVRAAGKVGIFDGWSSYGTLTLARGRADKPCSDSSHEDRRPLLFDEGEAFILRVGKNATILFPGS